jgi:hypothetical protein
MPGGRPAKPMTAPAPGATPSDGGALSSADAAAFLGLPLRTFQDLVYVKREVRPVYFGAKPVFLRAELVELLERKRLSRPEE